MFQLAQQQVFLLKGPKSDFCEADESSGFLAYSNGASVESR